MEDDGAHRLQKRKDPLVLVCELSILAAHGPRPLSAGFLAYITEPLIC